MNYSLYTSYACSHSLRCHPRYLVVAPMNLATKSMQCDNGLGDRSIVYTHARISTVTVNDRDARKKMERPEPLSSRSLNKPIPTTSILKRTIQTPSTIRKTTNYVRPSSPNKSSPSKTSSPGKGSPTRQWATNQSMQTPRQRPQSLIEQINVYISSHTSH